LEADSAFDQDFVFIYRHWQWIFDNWKTVFQFDFRYDVYVIDTSLSLQFVVIFLKSP
jgi:hypothetical protein